MSTRRRSLAVIGAVLLAGCTSSTARVPALAARGQSPEQRERDTARCDAFARDNGATERERDDGFAACMTAQGYRVSLPVRAGVDHGRVELQVPGQTSAVQVLSDLRACTGQVASARPSSPDVVVGSIGSVAGGDSTQVRPHSPRSEALERSYAACLSARGYSAAPAETPR